MGRLGTAALMGLAVVWLAGCPAASSDLTNQGSSGSPAESAFLLLGAGPGGSWAASYSSAGGWAVPQTSSVVSGLGVALAVDSTGVGIGLLADNGASPGLYQTLWTSAGWSAPVLLEGSYAGLGARAPALAANGADVELVFQDSSLAYRSGTRSGGTWGEVLALGASGPTAPGAAVMSTVEVAAFADAGSTPANCLAVQSRSGGSAGAWGSPIWLTPTAVSTAVAPVLVAPTGGTALVALYADAGAHLGWVVRDGGWSTPALVDSTAIVTAVTGAATAAGGVVAVVRGADGLLSWSLYQNGAWSALAALRETGITGTSPSLAQGVGSATAELVYLNASSQPMHSRLVNGAWTNPTLVNTTVLSQVRLARVP